MPDKNTQWLIGVVVAVGLGLAVQINAQIGGLRGEFRTAIAEIRTDIRRLDDRLRAVEVMFGKVDQRLAALERPHGVPQ